MKIVGLITEYNPFHNGHLYHIQEALRATGSDAAVAIMSGNYVQRGAPALMPKHLRARMALEAGVAAVIELPVWCACGSAEYFAAGAVSILDRLGCVDMICFGSECGDVSLLEKAAPTTRGATLCFGEKVGSPTLFSASLAKDLRALEGDRGGRSVLRALGGECLRVQAESARELEDIDLPGQLSAVCK